jgi:hypothetical protein
MGLGADAMRGKVVSIWTALRTAPGRSSGCTSCVEVLADGWAGFIIALWNFEGTFDRCVKCYERAQGHGLPSEDTAPVAHKM